MLQAEKKSGKESPKNKPPPKKEKHKEKPPCPWLCNLVPTNIPGPEEAQAVLHPRKDVFVLKVICLETTLHNISKAFRNTFRRYQEYFFK